MKNQLIAVVLLLSIASCNNKESDKNLTITGTIKGLNKGTLFLKKMNDTALVTIDSITIEGDNAFKYALDIKSPEMLYLFLDRGTTNSTDNSIMFFAEPGKINIDTDLEFFFAKAKIKGSKNQELYEDYKKIVARFNDQQLQLTDEKYEAIKNKQFDLLAKNQEQFDAIVKRKYLYAINFAVNNKEYEVAPYIALSEINNATIKYLDTIQKSMSPRVAESKYGKLLTEYVIERKKQE
ncbi:MAG: DUF4369 domain-containing protein [Bacteroidota bacterium]